jgi:hypothetical protein
VTHATPSARARYPPAVRPRGLRAFGAGVALASLVLAACGGGDDGPRLTPTSRAPAPTTTAAVSATSAATPPTVFTTTPAETPLGSPKLNDSSRVTTAGVGVLLFGMTVVEAEKAAGTRLLPDTSFTAGPQCIVLKPEKGPAGVWFMVSAGVVVRADIRPPAKVTTRSGAGIGTTEAKLQELFPGRLTSTATPDGGKVIVYTPSDPVNAAFRVIFDTDGKAVTSFRSGRTPGIEPSTPC